MATVALVVTDKTEILKRLERADREQISHDVIDTDPIQVRVENETPASRSDKTTHLVVVTDDAVISSSPDFLYRDVVADKYVLYLATQDEDLLLRERVRSILGWEDSIAQDVQDQQAGVGDDDSVAFSEGSDVQESATQTTDSVETRFRDFVNTLVGDN